MQLKSLRLLLAVCEHGSFGAAAQQGHTVQSNVTAHIQKLEEELGVQLVQRSTPVTATPAGQQLLPYARRMLQLHDEARALFAAQAAPSGCLRLGAMETTAALRLAPVLAALHQACPQVRLELRTGPTAQLLTDLAAGAVDAVLVAGVPPAGGWAHWPVFHEELVLVSARPLPRWPAGAQWLDTPFLAFRQGCSYRQRVELLLAAHGVTAGHIMELGSLDAILGCVAAGMGWALLPQAVVQAQQHRFALHLRRLPEPLRTSLAQVDTYLVTGPRAGWSAALQALAVELLGPEHGQQRQQQQARHDPVKTAPCPR